MVWRAIEYSDASYVEMANLLTFKIVGYVFAETILNKTIRLQNATERKY